MELKTESSLRYARTLLAANQFSQVFVSPNLSYSFLSFYFLFFIILFYFYLKNHKSEQQKNSNEEPVQMLCP